MIRFARFAWQRGQYWGTLEGDTVRRWNGAPYDGGVATDRLYPVSDITWLPPVTPSKIVAVGLNYAAHVAESASADTASDDPVIFMKPPTALLSPGASIILPAGVDRVDYEGELACVIGRRLHHSSHADVTTGIFGWTIANDVTARPLQKKDTQWTRAKGFDSFCPVGPWVQCEFDRTRSRLTTHLNEELRQETTFDRMIVPVEDLIMFISRVMTLQPGDLILTGTPAGVGPLSPGDTITIAVEGLGELSNSVGREIAGKPASTQ